MKTHEQIIKKVMDNITITYKDNFSINKDFGEVISPKIKLAIEKALTIQDNLFEKKLREKIDLLEFTNILRKYGCKVPNNCMDEIKDKLKEVFKD